MNSDKELKEGEDESVASQKRESFSKRELSNSQYLLQQQQQQQQQFESQQQYYLQEVPRIKFRDVVLAKKFGSSPYDSDR